MSKHKNVRGTPRESSVRWDLVRDNDRYEACEIRIDESEAISFACFAGDVRGLAQ